MKFSFHGDKSVDEIIERSWNPNDELTVKLFEPTHDCISNDDIFRASFHTFGVQKQNLNNVHIEFPPGPPHVLRRQLDELHAILYILRLHGKIKNVKISIPYDSFELHYFQEWPDTIIRADNAVEVLTVNVVDCRGRELEDGNSQHQVFDRASVLDDVEEEAESTSSTAVNVASNNKRHKTTSRPTQQEFDEVMAAKQMVERDSMQNYIYFIEEQMDKSDIEKRNKKLKTENAKLEDMFAIAMEEKKKSIDECVYLEDRLKSVEKTLQRTKKMIDSAFSTIVRNESKKAMEENDDAKVRLERVDKTLQKTKKIVGSAQGFLKSNGFFQM